MTWRQLFERVFWLVFLSMWFYTLKLSVDTAGLRAANATQRQTHELMCVEYLKIGIDDPACDPENLT